MCLTLDYISANFKANLRWVFQGQRQVKAKNKDIYLATYACPVVPHVITNVAL